MTGALRSKRPAWAIDSKPPKTRKTAATAKLATANLFGHLGSDHSLAPKIACNSTTPQKYIGMPASCTAGASLYGTAVIIIVPNVEITPINNAIYKNILPAPR